MRISTSSLASLGRDNNFQVFLNPNSITVIQESSHVSNNFLNVKPLKARAHSWQPDILNWDKEKHLSVQPELIGFVIESYITQKKASLESSEVKSVTETKYSR